MQNHAPFKRTVFLCLLLHTAIIMMLALLFARMDAGAPVIMISIAAGVALTVYTAHNIIHKSLERHAQDLQNRTKALNKYVIELRLWAGEMSDHKRELQKKVETLNEYNSKIDKLITIIEASKEAADESTAQSTSQ